MNKNVIRIANRIFVERTGIKTFFEEVDENYFPIGRSYWIQELEIVKAVYNQ